MIDPQMQGTNWIKLMEKELIRAIGMSEGKPHPKRGAATVATPMVRFSSVRMHKKGSIPTKTTQQYDVFSQALHIRILA